MSTPDQTHMADWPQGRSGERTCPHGIGHPCLAELTGDSIGVHGCDGCCQAPALDDQQPTIKVSLSDTREVWSVPGAAVSLPRVQGDRASGGGPR